jgi:hypothetical protein
MARRVGQRLSWGVADQAVSSLTNFAVSIYVARVLGATQPCSCTARSGWRSWPSA